MDELLIAGGVPLSGTVGVLGAKNAVLKHMVAALLAPGRYLLDNVPAILDVAYMAEVLEFLGARCRLADHRLRIDVPDQLNPEAPIDLVRRFRASIVVLGPLLARSRVARVALPGGDDFGVVRPVDWHLEGLARMGASFQLEHGVLEGRAPRGLRGTEVDLVFPSVGATENILLAAVLARGETIISNAAREPELVDLATFLQRMGARIEGAGTSTIRVEGVESLQPTTHTVRPDRLEAGTYAVAAAITGGDVRVTDCPPADLRMELRKLAEAGCDVETGDDWLAVAGPERPRAIDFATLPFPGFHTDLHPQMVALLSVASGTSVITENLYEARFRYIGELNRMGADITTESQHAVIRGVERLSGCPVTAHDIRAGAAVVLAGLRAEGETVVEQVHHIDRGYEDFVGKLQSLKAEIERRSVDG